MHTELRRNIGLLGLFSIAFASMIGVGWITLLGIWLQAAGSLGAVIAFAAAAVVVLFIVLAYAEVGSMYPVAGAEVAYAQVAFGRVASYVSGWMLAFVCMAVIAFEAISAGWILTVVFPQLKGPLLYRMLDANLHAGELIVGILCTILVTGWNLRAASLAAQAQTVLMLLKVSVSLLFIAAGVAGGATQHLEPWFTMPAEGGGLHGLFFVFSMAVMFYAGFNYLPQALEERAAGISAQRICRVMITAVVVAFLFYAAVILAAAMAAPRSLLLASELPAAAAFEAALGSRLLRNLVLLAGFLGILTAWNGTVFAGGRVLMLLGSLRLLPRAFATINPATATPTLAVMLMGVCGLAGACLGKGVIGPLVTVAATAIPAVWAIVCAGAWWLRRKAPDAPRPYRQKYGVLIFALGLASSLFALWITVRDAFGDSVGGYAPRALALALLVGSGMLLWLGMTRQRRGMSDAERVQLILSKR